MRCLYRINRWALSLEKSVSLTRRQRPRPRSLTIFCGHSANNDDITPKWNLSRLQQKLLIKFRVPCESTPVAAQHPQRLIVVCLNLCCYSALTWKDSAYSKVSCLATVAFRWRVVGEVKIASAGSLLSKLSGNFHCSTSDGLWALITTVSHTLFSHVSQLVLECCTIKGFCCLTVRKKMMIPLLVVSCFVWLSFCF